MIAMRSAFLLAALAAGCVNAIEKRVYVTDWTTVTVTTTITAPTVTETVPAVEKVPAPVVIETSTTAPAVADTSANTDLFKKSTVPPEAESTPTTVPKAQNDDGASTSWFSTAWTSTIEPVAPTTMATSSSSSSTSTSSTSTSTSSTASASPTSAYQQQVLYNHNIHRSNHSVSSVEWSADLEKSAQTLAARCVYEHNTYVYPAYTLHNPTFISRPSY